MNYKNLDDLFRRIEKEVQDTMTKEVADAATEEMKKTVRKSVYDVYSPKQYNRRYGNCGLGAEENIAAYEIPNGIAVENIAPLDNGRTDYELDDIIVHGYGNQPFPRDFYSDTVDSLETEDKIVNALEKGLKKRDVM